MDTIVAEVNAVIELNVEELINAVMSEYDEDINEVTMDYIFEYVNNGMSYLENKNAKGVYHASDGWSLNGFGKQTYNRIEEVLRKMQENAE